jgi:hypothetical protein
MSFDGANIQQFPDIPAASAEILALRGLGGREKEGGRPCAVAVGAALLGFGSIGMSANDKTEYQNLCKTATF